MKFDLARETPVTVVRAPQDSTCIEEEITSLGGTRFRCKQLSCRQMISQLATESTHS